MRRKIGNVVVAAGAIAATVAVAADQRRIDEIIVHCSATPVGREVTAADIDRWHRERGFDGIGYNYVIRLDGTVEVGRPLSRQGAHCFGHNGNSIGICYVGGLDAAGKPRDTRTAAQRRTMGRLIDSLRRVYPSAKIYGHRDFAKKDCPCFDAGKEYGR